jgi:hypothetical protein
LSHISSPFWSICLCWPHSKILLISASQVAKITGLSYEGLALTFPKDLKKLSMVAHCCIPSYPGN